MLSSNTAYILKFLKIDAPSKRGRKVIKINVFFGYRHMDLYIDTRIQIHGLACKYLQNINFCCKFLIQAIS